MNTGKIQTDEKPSIIITSPSIDTSQNVSGISSLTKLLIAYNKFANYYLIEVGRKDSQKRNAQWLLNQIVLIYNFSKKLIIEREIKIVHINIPLSKLAIYINFILVIISKIFNKKVLVHLRGGSLSLNKNVNRLEAFTILRCLKLADKIIVLGNKELLFVTQFYGVDTNKISVLSNAVDTPKNIQRRQKDAALKIIFIGRIDKDKGLEEILSALKALKNKINYHFYLAGTGPDEQKFIPKCMENLGDKFSYLEVLNSTEKIPFFQNADIFLLPTYFEGLPNALLESMAYGVVPIVTPVGSIPEVVIDEKNGFIVPLNDYHSISDKITMLYNDRNLLEKLGKASHLTISDSYSIDVYIRKLNAIYDSLLIME